MRVAFPPTVTLPPMEEPGVGGVLMVNVEDAEVCPLVVVDTVTAAVPGEATMPAVTGAVSSAELPNVVTRDVPFQFTTALES